MNLQYSKLETSRFDRYAAQAVLSLFILTWIFKASFNNIAIIICLLVWVISKGYRSVFDLRKDPFVLWTFAFVFILGLTILYSHNKEEAWTVLGRKVLLPVMAITFPFLISLADKRKLLGTYVGVWFFGSLYSIITTILKYGLDVGNFSYFSWVLPNSLGIDSTYYALFIAVSFLIAISDVKENLIFKSRYISLGLALYFFCFLVLLSSRVQFFSSLFVLVLFPLFYFQNWGKRLIAFYMVSILILGVFATLASPFLRDKTMLLIQQNDPRFSELKAGIALFIKSPLLGVGIGDVNEELINMYKAIGFEQGVIENFNVHNEFLHDGIAAGILGIFFTVLVCAMSLLGSLRSMNYLQFGFSVIFSACLLSEVVLNRQKGITVFAFFLALLFIKSPNEKNLAH